MQTFLDKISHGLETDLGDFALWLQSGVTGRTAGSLGYARPQFCGVGPHYARAA